MENHRSPILMSQSASKDVFKNAEPPPIFCCLRNLTKQWDCGGGFRIPQKEEEQPTWARFPMRVVTAEREMSDILRIWFRMLTKEKTDICTEVSERDLSKDISLKSGLRTPNSVIDLKIRQFRQAPGKNAAMFQTLNNRPEQFLAPPISQSQYNDPSDINLSLEKKNPKQVCKKQVTQTDLKR